MYFKYKGCYDDGEHTTIIKSEHFEIMENDDEFSLVALDDDKTCDILDAAIERVLSLLPLEFRPTMHEFNIKSTVYGNFSCNGDKYANYLQSFDTKEDAERAMNEITEAIARGDRIFDMTKYDRKTD